MIREINLNTSLVSTLAGAGDTTASINAPDSSASFYYPTGVAIDASGNVYVAEYVSNLIRKIGVNGQVTTFAGSGTAGQADSTGTSATFNGPSGLTIDKSGNLYVADTYNNVIRKITPAGVVSTIAGSGAAGATNGKALSLKRRTLAHVVSRPNSLSRKSLDRIFIKKRKRK
jgi:secreted PhoX family phosphatase